MKPICTHDGCSSDASYTVTAAYPACKVVHPHFATYPAPLARVCATHLDAVIRSDASHPGATPAYLVAAVTR